LILLLAAALRLYRLDVVPPGLTHDEADLSYDAIRVYRGARPIYVATHGYQDEPFMHYASAFVMTVVGPSYFAVRLTSAAFGMALVLLTFVWARMAFGSSVALGAAALLAVSYWPVATSRFALQVEPIASIFVLANIFLYKAMEFDCSRAWDKVCEIIYWILFVLCLAASVYAYEAARITWLLFPAFGLYLSIAHPECFKRSWAKFVLALLSAALLSLPILTHPAAWDRASKLAGPLEALMRGSFAPLLESSIDVLAMFSFQGDPFVTYNLSGRPILGLFTSLLFYGGLLMCLWRWHRQACALTFLWLLIGILPSLLTGVHSASLRSVVAKPVVYVVVALALDRLVGWLADRFRLPARYLFLVGLLVLTVGVGLKTYLDYFVRWANSAETKRAYFSDVFQAVRYLDEHASDCPILFSSPFPTLPHDPYIADVMLTEHDLELRWIDGRRALVFPDSPRVNLLVLSRAPLNDLFRQQLASYQNTRIPIEGYEEYFDVFEWEPMLTWGSLLARYGTTHGAAQDLVLPIDFGESVRLLSYSVSPLIVVPGDQIQVVTFWQILDPAPLGPVPPGFYGYDAAIFVHLMDENGQIVAQEDRLDAPAWNWQPGETFIHIHYLETEPTFHFGSYTIELGVFTRPDLQRLAVSSGEGIIGDHILLQPLEVVAP
jgi:hypothetical protein